MQGMEVFSTVLWHLKEELALSHLAQQVIAQDRHSPHAWAVLGNCFSLQKVWSRARAARSGGLAAGAVLMLSARCHQLQALRAQHDLRPPKCASTT